MSNLIYHKIYEMIFKIVSFVANDKLLENEQCSLLVDKANEILASQSITLGHKTSSFWNMQILQSSVTSTLICSSNFPGICSFAWEN